MAAFLRPYSWELSSRSPGYRSDSVQRVALLCTSQDMEGAGGYRANPLNGGRVRKRTSWPSYCLCDLQMSALNSSHVNFGCGPALAFCGPFWPEYPCLLKWTARKAAVSSPSVALGCTGGERGTEWIGLSRPGICPAVAHTSVCRIGQEWRLSGVGFH